MDTPNIQQKAGPLPMWAWAAIPAGAYVVFSYYRAAKAKKDAANAAPVDEMVGGAAGGPADSFGINTGSGWLPSYGAAPAGTSNLPYTEPAPYNNLTWSKQAVNFLIGEGVAPADAVTAINAYIFGYPQQINSTQMDALQRALTKLGPAPEGSSYLPTLLPADTSTVTPQPSPATPSPVTTPAPTPVPGQPGKPYQSAPNLYVGSQGPWVTTLQQWLNSNAGQNVPVNGTFGPETAAAVDNLVKFMSGGRDSANYVDQEIWGLLQYISELHGVPGPGQ